MTLGTSVLAPLAKELTSRLFTANGGHRSTATRAGHFCHWLNLKKTAVYLLSNMQFHMYDTYRVLQSQL